MLSVFCHHPWFLRLSTSLLFSVLLQPLFINLAWAQENSAVLSEDVIVVPSISNINQASYSYTFEEGEKGGQTNAIELEVSPELLVDPLGQILGCGGEPLADYSGFTVGLFSVDPTDPTQSELGPLIPLTPTEVPDVVDNGIPAGLEPNDGNINPFPLSNNDVGRYSFLLNQNEGQVDVGQQYILVIEPPADSVFQQRRIRLEITDSQPINGSDRLQIQYEAVSLDGLPIGIQGETEIDQTVVVIEDAEQVGLQLLALQLVNTLCSPNQIEIVKTGDRANAAPGDTIIYRLSIRNISDVQLDAVTVSDILPAGFKFLEEGFAAELAGQQVPLTASTRGLNVTFETSAVIPVDEILTIVYAAVLTPDSIRGDGLNSASVSAERIDNDLIVRDGPSIHRVRITPGLLSDCGTVLGRVFEDYNFDGEQQSGEPGIPNAVIIMDDGNKITTDARGLFSVKCVLPGYRTGALDLTLLPGYTIAPNLRFIERNSPSRLVRLAPGGLVRMNFGVTPIDETEGD